MIVKSLRHTTPRFRYIVNYIFDGIPKQKDFRWIMMHNLSTGADRESIISEFEENAQYLQHRINPSRKKVYKYHEILAFAKDSTPNLTKEKLLTIIKEYIRLRDPSNSALAICVPHYETGKTIHLHLLVSSNHLLSNKSSDMRMDNSFYYELRRNIERITLKHFPELHQSTVYLDKKEIAQLLPKKILAERKEQENSTHKDFGKQTKKQFVADTVQAILDTSTSLNNFTHRVNASDGFATYSRNGKLTGVIKDGEKYRFKTLGILLLPENLKVLERLDELENLQRKQEREQGQSMER